MGISNLGGIIGAFAPSKMERMYNNEGLQKQIDTSIGGMDQYRKEADTAVGNYTGANRRAIGEVTRLNQQTEGETNQMLGGLRNASFMGDRERARSGDLAALQGLLGQMGGGMSKADKMAASRLGYAGKPSSSYMDKQRSSYIGSFGAPIAQQIFGGLNQAAGGAAAERGQNISQQMGLMGYRNSLPMNLAEMELNPLKARQAARQSEIGQLGGLSDVNNSNFAGFQEKKNKWAALGEAMDSSVNSAIDTGLTLYSGGLLGGKAGGGGLLGGMLGGLIGKAGQPAAAAAAAAPAAASVVSSANPATWRAPMLYNSIRDTPRSEFYNFDPTPALNYSAAESAYGIPSYTPNFVMRR